MLNMMCDKVMIMVINMMVSIRAVIEGYNLEHLSRLSSLGVVRGLSGKLKVTHFYVCMSEPSFATTASKLITRLSITHLTRNS